MSNTEQDVSMKIPIIDIFAGPGGLGEGFSSYKAKGESVFKIALSIEKEFFAHQTLQLRSFYRQFSEGQIPADYYLHLRGKISKDELFSRHPKEAEAAESEAWKATLGDTPAVTVDERIKQALDGKKEWVLIGGPPCQAYSLAGRSRMAQDKKKHLKDIKHFLYEEYLRIIEEHQPALFVMENVKGLLSAVIPDETGSMFEKILKDLQGPGYKIYSLSTKAEEFSEDGSPKYKSSSDFLIKSEKYGIPQSRHRVILLGIRSDLNVQPSGILASSKKSVSVRRAISDLPKLRSRISSRDAADTFEAWGKLLREFPVSNEIDKNLRSLINRKLGKLSHENTGDAFIPFSNKKITRNPLRKWYFDPCLSGACNHESRSHMSSDLHRYFFAACYAALNKRSPSLNDFPKNLYPKHENVSNNDGTIIFADRFRVQVSNRPSTTIVSHISKDGHYYIHYDPTQARSLTVREAARLQTFPDNYFFEGQRTSQYQQVGNAVPPLLANKIAAIAYSTIAKTKSTTRAGQSKRLVSQR